MKDYFFVQKEKIKIFETICASYICPKTAQIFELVEIESIVGQFLSCQTLRSSSSQQNCVRS